MHFFDLHCDTLYRALVEGKKLDDESLDVSFKKMCSLDLYVGCFAIWIPDMFRGENAMEIFNNSVNLLEDYIKQHSYDVELLKNKNDLRKMKQKGRGHGIIISVEGGAVLGGNIESIDCLYKKSVKMMTLTWNGSCEIGDGVGVDCAKGLSEFGFKVVKKMEELSMIIDLSHASERLFYDVAEITKKPFVLSHSNSKFVCKNKRNITNNQFKIVKDRKGLVGINFCKDFLDDKRCATFDNIRCHVEHFLELGGDDNLAFGSDWDGSEVLEDVRDIKKTKDLYEYFLIKNYNEKILRKIFFENAFNFIFTSISG